MEWGSGSGSRPEVDSKAARQARPTRALLRRPADPPPTRNPRRPAPLLPGPLRGLARPPVAPQASAGCPSAFYSPAPRTAEPGTQRGCACSFWERRGALGPPPPGGVSPARPWPRPPGRRCFPSSPDDPLPPDGAGSLEGRRLEALQRCGVEGSAGFDARPALSSAAPAAENAGNLPMGGLGAVLQ